MTPKLSPALQRIVDAEKDHKNAWGSSVPHSIAFTSVSDDLAHFRSEGALLVPTVGQRVSLHGVAVRVTDVDTSYECTDDGRSSIISTVTVEECEDE
ncbi:hypothetical protein [Streptomyces sp.]|uniref:hypothetical protein n=1 Tax=Streptomyces sp. TaxID=1931 RepID=UPI002F92B0EA